MADGFSSVRAEMPIPKIVLTVKSPLFAYFEVRILEKNGPSSIGIGFCCKEFPLENTKLGFEKNSIGIWNKGGLNIDEEFIKFGEDSGEFEVGEIVGIGIMHSPRNEPGLKCFASYKGELIGMADVPAKFATLELFPTAALFPGNAMRANFGKDAWLYDPKQLK